MDSLQGSCKICMTKFDELNIIPLCLACGHSICKQLYLDEARTDLQHFFIDVSNIFADDAELCSKNKVGIQSTQKTINISNCSSKFLKWVSWSFFILSSHDLKLLCYSRCLRNFIFIPSSNVLFIIPFCVVFILFLPN